MGNKNSNYQTIQEEHNYQTIKKKPNVCDAFERQGMIEYSSKYNKWLAIISFAGFHHHRMHVIIGYYDTPEEAVKKIGIKIKSIFGEAENQPLEIQQYKQDHPDCPMMS
jgi:hypothetical protein